MLASMLQYTKPLPRSMTAWPRAASNVARGDLKISFSVIFLIGVGLTPSDESVPSFAIVAPTPSPSSKLFR
ncbi:hypothetical protein [Sphingobium fuliginis]|jgi:cytochrome b561|uniref:Uncharacterized protein n=1 Tax=Sphingobium lactosutens DS20 TaxID=1331060 RepID=T0IGR8_9SPHN|nr:hypothetical protein [Sphingobium fuliginis]EQB10865.1 hypothetical protein RLDS_25855 [Sphingobium lactosutens DS20]